MFKQRRMMNKEDIYEAYKMAKSGREFKQGCRGRLRLSAVFSDQNYSSKITAHANARD